MGTIPSRREVRGLTPLRLRAWISVSAAAYFRVLALYPLLQMLQTLD